MVMSEFGIANKLLIQGYLFDGLPQRLETSLAVKLGVVLVRLALIVFATERLNKRLLVGAVSIGDRLHLVISATLLSSSAL